MFKEWGFLLGEIWVLLALAALIGLLAGWLIWGRRSTVHADHDDSALQNAEARAAKAERELADLRAAQGANAAAAADAGSDQAAALRAKLDACHDARSEAETRIEDLEAALAECRASAAVTAPAASVAAPVIAAAADMDAGSKPTTLDAPRGGMGDDLTQINGIGPKLSKLCNDLGFWHFDQIAAWTDSEVAWVDHNLEGFKGRVTRDDWVAQAKVLAQKS